MKSETVLPSAWTEVQSQAGQFAAECPKCLARDECDASAFTTPEAAGVGRLRPLGEAMRYISNGQARVAWAIAALITVVVVFTFVPTGGLDQVAKGMTYLVAIPVFFGSQFLIRQLLFRSLDLWKLQCATCQRELILAVRGTLLTYGEPGASKGDDSPEGESSRSESDERAIASLADKLATADNKTRKRAVEGLVALGVKTRNRAAIEPLVDYQKTEADGGVEGAIEFALNNQISGIRPVGYIRQGLKSDDETISDLAYQAFFRKGNAAALDALKQAMESGNGN